MTRRVPASGEDLIVAGFVPRRTNAGKCAMRTRLLACCVSVSLCPPC